MNEVGCELDLKVRGRHLGGAKARAVGTCLSKELGSEMSVVYLEVRGEGVREQGRDTVCPRA